MKCNCGATMVFKKCGFCKYGTVAEEDDAEEVPCPKCNGEGMLWVCSSCDQTKALSDDDD